jgi:rhodanese-related sulfurtransferase
MTTLAPITPQDAAIRLKSGRVTLVDIREADEHAREHIAGAVSMPLSALEKGHINLAAHGDVVFHCKSGMRTSTNCARLATHVEGPAFMLEGGLDAWKRAGLGVRKKAGAPIELMRQVQIVIGLFVLTGIALTLTVHPGFIVIPAFMGAGLTFAGLSGWCGMAKLIALAPWNRQAA